MEATLIGYGRQCHTSNGIKTKPTSYSFKSYRYRTNIGAYGWDTLSQFLVVVPQSKMRLSIIESVSYFTLRAYWWIDMHYVYSLININSSNIYTRVYTPYYLVDSGLIFPEYVYPAGVCILTNFGQKTTFQIRNVANMMVHIPITLSIT